MRDYGIEAIPFEGSVDVHLRGITKSHDQGVTAPRKVGGKTRLTVFIASDVQTGGVNTGFHELPQFQIAVETLGDMYAHPDQEGVSEAYTAEVLEELCAYFCGKISSDSGINLQRLFETFARVEPIKIQMQAMFDEFKARQQANRTQKPAPPKA